MNARKVLIVCHRLCKFRDRLSSWSQQTGLFFFKETKTLIFLFKVHVRKKRRKSTENVAMLEIRTEKALLVTWVSEVMGTERGFVKRMENRSRWECCIAGFHLKQCHRQKDTQTEELYTKQDTRSFHWLSSHVTQTLWCFFSPVVVGGSAVTRGCRCPPLADRGLNWTWAGSPCALAHGWSRCYWPRARVCLWGWPT